MKIMTGPGFCDVGLDMTTLDQEDDAVSNGGHWRGILGVFRRRIDTGSWNANTGESIFAAIGSV